MKIADEMAVAADRVKAPPRKQLSQGRCASGLTVLGSDKSVFKIWNETRIKAISQSLGAPWRLFMKNLNRKLDQDRKVLTADELNN